MNKDKKELKVRKETMVLLLQSQDQKVIQDLKVLKAYKVFKVKLDKKELMVLKVLWEILVLYLMIMNLLLQQQTKTLQMDM